MRKYKLPDEIAYLPAEQIQELNDWLSRFTYEKTQQLFLEKHGKTIHIMKLCRYYQRHQQALLLSDPARPTLASADLVALRNGDPVPDARINKELLQERCFQIAHQPAQLRARRGEIRERELAFAAWKAARKNAASNNPTTG